VEANPLRSRGCRVEANGTTDFTDLQVTFPLSAMCCHFRPSNSIPKETKRHLFGSGALVGLNHVVQCEGSMWWFQRNVRNTFRRTERYETTGAPTAFERVMEQKDKLTWQTTRQDNTGNV
jgi:hypothetical protein